MTATPKKYKASSAKSAKGTAQTASVSIMIRLIKKDTMICSTLGISTSPTWTEKKEQSEKKR